MAETITVFWVFCFSRIYYSHICSMALRFCLGGPLVNEAQIFAKTRLCVSSFYLLLFSFSFSSGFPFLNRIFQIYEASLRDDVTGAPVGGASRNKVNVGVHHTWAAQLPRTPRASLAMGSGVMFPLRKFDTRISKWYNFVAAVRQNEGMGTWVKCVFGRLDRCK